MKKVLWTLDVDNYLPEVTKLTYPYLRLYAQKIGAEFRIIDTRKFPKHAPVYEKLQIHELGGGNDYNVFIDADALIHPDFFDITAMLPNDVCFHLREDFSPIRFRPQPEQIADGRFIGTCGWFAVSTKRTHIMWRPVDMLKEEMDGNLFPTVGEKQHGITAEHLEDDFAVSLNIAKYGLKHFTYKDLADRCPRLDNNSSFWFHDYFLTPKGKEEKIKECIKTWGI
jgi:hypothetical protein